MTGAMTVKYYSQFQAITKFNGKSPLLRFSLVNVWNRELVDKGELSSDTHRLNLSTFF